MLFRSLDKHAVARCLAEEQKVEQGLVCVLTSVEPCQSFRVLSNRQTKHLELKRERRQCLHLYHYWIDPEFGWMNARIQTWFPFRIQVCLNGREWLGQQMRKAGMKYVRQDNCFPWIENFDRAQKLMDEQVQHNWPKVLQTIAGRLNPVHGEIFRHYRVNYYWTTFQSEWAIDVRFEHQEDLKRFYPLLLQHGITTFGSPDVLRFLGRRVARDGQPPEHYEGELFSDVKRRVEGVRIKHSIDGNSIKAYDKAYTDLGSILRAETTINRVRGFWVYRPKEGEPQGPLAWRIMRRGVADLYRRAELSQKATGRYLNALASLDDSARLQELTERLEQPTRWKQQRIRGLRVLGADQVLLQAVSRGEFNLHGFRNRDLQPHLYSSACPAAKECRRRSAAVGRKLRILRAHGLIEKLPHTHRYQLTEFGRLAITAILAAQQATVTYLTKAA